MLLAAAMIWGCAFVAQSVGMDHMGPFAFQGVRSLLGCLALLPALALKARVRKYHPACGASAGASKGQLLKAGLSCGAVLSLATNLQQLALVETSAGKAGFLTALYILIVPVLGVFMGRKPRPVLWLCVGAALCGLYFLCVTGAFVLARADAYLILCAFVFAAHILLVDRYSPKVDAVSLSCLQFLVSGLLSGLAMLLFEAPPTAAALLSAWAPLLYAGVLSSGLAYTLQIVGQKRCSPTLASLIMSLESVFAMAAGAALLAETPSAREMFGSALMFAAILLAQLSQRPAPAGRASA